MNQKLAHLIFRAAPIMSQIALCLAVLSGCQSQSNPSRSSSFDWDTDLSPLDTKPNEGELFPWQAETFDRKFCQDLAPGACLSLVIRVPKADLVQDMGLSILAIGSKSQNMSRRLEEACQSAWIEYKGKYNKDLLYPLRSKLVKKVEKMRCIFQFMGEEIVTENLKLADNEIGLSARLTKFDLSGEEQGGDIRSIGIQIKRTEIKTQFRSVAIYSGEKILNTKSGWQLAEKLGSANLKVQSQLNKDLQWKIDFLALSENLSKVAINNPNLQQEITSFFSKAKNSVAQLSSSSQNLGSTMALVGLGYNAFRSLCGENREFCKAYTTKIDTNSTVSEDLADLIPSSETNELFRLAVIRSVQGILDTVLSQADSQQIKNKFSIP